MKLGRLLLTVYVALFFVALYTPIAILVGLSFNAGDKIYVWEGFSTKWYGSAFSIPDYKIGLANSFIVALATTGLSIVLGTLAGIGLSRIGSGRYGFLWDALILLPIILPEIIEAYSISLFYQSLRFPLGIPATIVGHTVFAVSFVALIVRSRMADVGPSYEEASMVLGANRLQTFANVVLPLASPAIIAGSFLAFAASFDDVVKSLFTMAPPNLLPLKIFAEAQRGGVNTTLNVVATVTVLISISAAFVRVFMETRISRS